MTQNGALNDRKITPIGFLFWDPSNPKAQAKRELLVRAHGTCLCEEGSPCIIIGAPNQFHQSRLAGWTEAIFAPAR